MKNQDLFGDTPQQTHTITVQPQVVGAALSRTQKQFNTLCQKIERKRILLSEWQTALVEFRKKMDAEFMPLLHEYDLLRSKMAFELDSAWSEPKGWTKKERDKLSRSVLGLIESVLAERTQLDDKGKDQIPALKALFEKHAGLDFETVQEQELAEMEAMKRSLFETTFGVKLDPDIDLADMEQIHAFLDSNDEKMKAHLDAQYGFVDDGFDFDFDSGAQSTKPQTEKQRAKAQAKADAYAAKMAAAEQAMSQSLKSVYRQLASSLHPDREPDAEQRERKTALMQQVNIAYEAQDLLKMLSLQLEVEQITQETVNHLPEERLRHFNEVLKNQLQELEAEIADVEMSIRMSAQVENRTLVPKQLSHFVERDKIKIKKAIKGLTSDLEAFVYREVLKQWLRYYVD